MNEDDRICDGCGRVFEVDEDGDAAGESAPCGGWLCYDRCLDAHRDGACEECSNA